MAKRRRRKKSNDKLLEACITVILWTAFLPFMLIYVVIKFIVKSLAQKRTSARSAAFVSGANNVDQRLPFSFDAVGVKYREENLLSLVEPARNFELSDEKFLEKYADGRRIYKYYFPRFSAELVPDPTNPNDTTLTFTWLPMAVSPSMIWV